MPTKEEEYRYYIESPDGTMTELTDLLGEFEVVLAPHVADREGK